MGKSTSYNCHCDSPNVRTSFYQLSQLDQPLISSADDNLINDLQRYEREGGYLYLYAEHVKVLQLRVHRGMRAREVVFQLLQKQVSRC